MSYWNKRQEETYRIGERTINEYYAGLEKAFNQTKKEVSKEIEAFFFRYAQENGVTYAEALKRLSKTELGELEDFIKMSLASIGTYNQELNNLSIKARMTRLEALGLQTDAILTKLYAKEYEGKGTDMMKEVYKDTYYRTWFNIDQYRGFHSEFAKINERAIDALIEYPFNGANFSSRLWKQKESLKTKLMELVTTSVVQGKHPRQLSSELAKKFQTSKFEAYRLLHTENSYIIEQATLKGYEEGGVKKYRILATLDSRTCGICGDMDREVYEREKAVVGQNYPPFHPLCRCTTVPYDKGMEEADDTRFARDEEGKAIQVPTDMTYKQWKDGEYKKKSVENSKKDDIIKTKESALQSQINTLLSGSNTDRVTLGQEILKEYGVQGVDVRVKGMTDFGYCSVNVKNGLLQVQDYNLSVNDNRELKYQIKTAFHEAYHASGNGFKTDIDVMDRYRWLDIEETFAESSAHFMARSYGITDLTPSYPDKLVKMLPRLKKLPEFSQCDVISDFGKVAYEMRKAGGGSAWKSLSISAMQQKFTFSTYVQQYFPEIRKDVPGYVDKILENMPESRKLRTYMIGELEKAMGNIDSRGHTLSDDESLLLNNAIAIAMNRMGVK